MDIRDEASALFAMASDLSRSLNSALLVTTVCNDQFVIEIASRIAADQAYFAGKAASLLRTLQQSTKGK